MKMSKLITLSAVLWLGASAAFADEPVTVVHVWNDPGGWWNGHFVYATGPRYTANELSVDAFGSYLAGETKEFEEVIHHSIRHNGAWGGGVGVNYFFTEMLGIGGDLNIPDNGGNFIDSVSGNLIARFPIEPCGIAPYVFGGGGRGTGDPVWQWFGQAGVGIEYRFNPVTGVFSDARYIWNDKTPNALLIRAGLRFVF